MDLHTSSQRCNCTKLHDESCTEMMHQSNAESLHKHLGQVKRQALQAFSRRQGLV
jgi:hypothetical protein